VGILFTFLNLFQYSNEAFLGIFLQISFLVLVYYFRSTKLNTLEGNIVPSVAQAKSSSLEEDIGLSAGGLQIPKTCYSQPQNPGKNEKRVPTTITTR